MNYVIGISGGSCSGKTLVGKTISEYLNKKGIMTTILSQDDFYKNIPDGCDITNYNFDDIKSIEIDRLKDAIEKLKMNHEIKTPINDFKVNKCIGYKTIIPQKIIIVEGIFILAHEPVRNLLDLKIFVETCAEKRLLRRLKRDVKERGRDMDLLEIQYMKYVRPAFESIIKPSKHFSDITIHNEQDSHLIGIDIVCDHVQNKNK